jgi:hypothetical protein
MLEKYSAKDIADAEDAAPPFPVGLVPAYIKSVEEKMSKNGNDMLVVTFLSCDRISASVKDYIVDGGEFAVRKLKSLEKAFGVPFGSGAEAFAGKRGVVRTVLDEYNGYKKAKVAGYAPYDANIKYESYTPENDSKRSEAPERNASSRAVDVPF